MASAEEEEEEKERAVFDNDDDNEADDSDEEDEDDEDDDEDTDADLPASAAAAAGAAPPPPPMPPKEEPSADSAAAAAAAAPTSSNANGNRNRNPAPNGSAASSEETRRLFQRLWTDEEELVILRGFSEFTTRRGTAFASHQYDTGPFYEDMKRQLQLDFSKSQLVEKLRRLKKKYRNCVARIRSAGPAFTFRSPHEQAVFEVARNIWSPTFKRSRHDPDPDDPLDDDDPQFDDPDAAAVPPIYINTNNDDDVDGNNSDSDRKPPRSRSRPRSRQRRRRLRRAAAAATAAEDAITAVSVPITVTVVENSVPPASTKQQLPPPPAVNETVGRSSLSLLFKELVGSAIGRPLGSDLGFKGEGFLGFGGGGNSMNMNNLRDERWKKQQILELEVYLKRLELLQEHIKLTLEELKSSSREA